MLYKRLNHPKEYNYYYQTIILYNERRFILKFGLFANLNEEILIRFKKPDENGYILTSNSGDLRSRQFVDTLSAKDSFMSQYKHYGGHEKMGMNMYPTPGGFAVPLKSSFLQIYSKFCLGVIMPNIYTFEILMHRNL